MMKVSQLQVNTGIVIDIIVTFVDSVKQQHYTMLHLLVCVA